MNKGKFGVVQSEAIAGGRRARLWRSPECLGIDYPPPAAQRLPWPPAPYPCVVQRNANSDTFQVRRSDTYPLIRTPESRCQGRLTNNRSTDGRGRPFDMEHDDVLQVWQQSPHKDTLGFYGVGSPAQQPESLKFNQLLAQCLDKASGITRQRPNKPQLPPQLRRVQSSKPSPSQPCPTLILNRWALQQEVQRMPHVQQQLTPQRATNSMYCWVNPDRKSPFGLREVHSQQKPLHNLNRQRPVAPNAPRRTKVWYCPPCCVPSLKSDLRNQEAYDQPVPGEPKNYDELYNRLVTCFEPKEDPVCKVYEACCKPKKNRGKDGGAGGTGGGAGGTGGAGGSGGGDGDGEESDYKIGRERGPGSGSVLRDGSNHSGSHGEGDGGREKVSRGNRGNRGDRGDNDDTVKREDKRRNEEGDSKDGKSKVPNDTIKNKGDGVLIEINKEKDVTRKIEKQKKDKDGESTKSKFDSVRKDKNVKTSRDEPLKKDKNSNKDTNKEDFSIEDPPHFDEDVEDYKPVRPSSIRASRTPSRVQMEQPPEENIPEIPKEPPVKKPTKKRGHSKEKKSDSPQQDKEKKPPCPPCPPPDCKCEICTFMQRRHKEPEAPFIREMRRAEKRLQLRNYYRQMCHRSYLACRTDEEYRAPLRKCDPIQCEDFFCGNTRLYEHCECLGAVQELQKLLKGTSNKRLLDYVDNLCQRICQRMCDCILT